MNGTRKLWGLPVLWLWRRGPDPPPATVVFVYVTPGGIVTAPASPSAVAGRTARALPAADGGKKA